MKIGSMRSMITIHIQRHPRHKCQAAIKKVWQVLNISRHSMGILACPKSMISGDVAIVEQGIVLAPHTNTLIRSEWLLPADDWALAGQSLLLQHHNTTATSILTSYPIAILLRLEDYCLLVLANKKCSQLPCRHIMAKNVFVSKPHNGKKCFCF